MLAVSSRPSTRIARRCLSLTTPTRNDGPSSASSSSAAPRPSSPSAPRRSNSTPTPGSSRGRGRSEGAVRFKQEVLRRGDGGSALSRPRLRPGQSFTPSNPSQFDDASSSSLEFRPAAHLVNDDLRAGNRFSVRPASLRGPPPSSFARGDGVPGSRPSRGGFAGRGGGGGGRGGARKPPSTRTRKEPEYTGASFLSADKVSVPKLAPSTLADNTLLYTSDEFFLSSSSDAPLPTSSTTAGGEPTPSFPPKSPFYAKLRAKVYAEAPTSGLRVLKHRLNNEHLLIPALGPSALAAGQQLVGPLPMLQRRSAKLEDQLLAGQKVEEFDPQSESWKAPGKVDYSKILEAQFDPYKPGKPHPRRIFRLSTSTPLEGAPEALSFELVKLESPTLPSTAGNEELFKAINAERSGSFSRWANSADLTDLARSFASYEGSGAFKPQGGRQAAHGLKEFGLGAVGNVGFSGRERKLVESVVEGMLKL